MSITENGRKNPPTNHRTPRQHRKNNAEKLEEELEMKSYKLPQVIKNEIAEEMESSQLQMRLRRYLQLNMRMKDQFTRMPTLAITELGSGRTRFVQQTWCSFVSPNFSRYGLATRSWVGHNETAVQVSNLE